MAAFSVDQVTQQPSPRGAIVAKQVALYAAMTLFGLIMLGPFILAIFGAFKTDVDVTSYPPTLLPKVWHPENFLNVAKLFPSFPRWFVNSIGLSTAVTVLNVFFCALAGYAFARLNFPGRTVLFLAVLATLMIPLQVTLIPKFIIMKQLGLINTYPGVILQPEMQKVPMLVAPWETRGETLYPGAKREIGITFEGEYWMYRFLYRRPPPNSFAPPPSRG